MFPKCWNFYGATDIFVCVGDCILTWIKWLGLIAMPTGCELPFALCRKTLTLRIQSHAVDTQIKRRSLGQKLFFICFRAMCFRAVARGINKNLPASKWATLNNLQKDWSKAQNCWNEALMCPAGLLYAGQSHINSWKVRDRLVMTAGRGVGHIWIHCVS